MWKNSLQNKTNRLACLSREIIIENCILTSFDQNVKNEMWYQMYARHCIEIMKWNDFSCNKTFASRTEAINQRISDRATLQNITINRYRTPIYDTYNCASAYFPNTFFVDLINNFCSYITSVGNVTVLENSKRIDQISCMPQPSKQ